MGPFDFTVSSVCRLHFACASAALCRRCHGRGAHIWEKVDISIASGPPKESDRAAVRWVSRHALAIHHMIIDEQVRMLCFMITSHALT